ncbi:hypothetical protein ANCDUO_06406 [Ancylostoma duodenale]|uniref:Phosphatidylinositol-3-phosphatase SAC1 n=1 Tax=Ancylostoma duodenale TaxID=51022 RepID=A0A0C2GPM6_9BILA|nr:hypothetical protein ANCDUO_06406 [Ancylostoma duodenale]
MSTDVYDGFNLYILAEKFYLEPRDRDGNLLSQQYLEIDRHSNQIRVSNASVNRIPLADADIQYIHGVLGIIPIVSGMALIVIRKSRLIGKLNGHPIYTITETDIIPYKKTTLHLTEKQAARFMLPVIHGFYGEVHHCVNGHQFKLSLISRRSKYRAGVRFYKRGVSADGHPANFVETEQIVETASTKGRRLTSFLQTRGSIPLLWSQRPNLKWQPMPTMKASDDQLAAYVKHFENQRKTYGGQHVIVNLINQTGREKKIGSELERIVQQANLSYVRYNPFDFHKECHAMQWHRLSLLKDQLRHEITQFGTNVVQAMIARESLTDQLCYLGILTSGQRVETCEDLETSFKHLWADNGDECSRQYAGTGALKADFTRLGKRTYTGAINDAINAITRYFRNNFADGYRQDAMDVFLGNFVIDVHNLPSSLEATLISLDQNGIALLAACFAMAMTLLCVLVAENISATLFWFAVFLMCMMFIFLNGEDFVNAPKLKLD